MVALEKFRQIAEAYDILSDGRLLFRVVYLQRVKPIMLYSCCFLLVARKRAVYDQFGEEGLKNGVPKGIYESGAWTQGYTFHGNPEKVFRDFFGGDNPFQGNIQIFP